jgi:hypothetical protein
MLVSGYCHATETEQTTYSDCDAGAHGAWALAEAEVRSIETALKACLHRCEQCPRCKIISVSKMHQDCSWFHRCDLNRLHIDVSGFFSIVANKSTRRQICSRLSQPMKASAASQSNSSYEAWGRARAERHPPRPPDKLLSKAAVLEYADERLCRLFTKLQGGKASVAILGGSVSYGHGVARAKDRYDMQLRAALSDIWGASISVTNAAMPATSAGFATLCLSTLLPTVADLVVIEYSWNTLEVAKLESLILAVRERGSAVVILDYGTVHDLQAFEKCRRERTPLKRCAGHGCKSNRARRSSNVNGHLPSPCPHPSLAGPTSGCDSSC